ncbi:Ig-like domain-containing protein [Actinacidiphila soli]|uniref:Ig-like domain-containing protein n=1 Tax=Actinacidiphila soli TaxID=2487275 RepID=UPI000FCC82FE|nr:Ig-like domain-containing protein [Actinacidiphila soli]
MKREPRATVLAATAVISALLLTLTAACSGSGGSGGSGGSSKSPAAATITVSPASGGRAVAVNRKVTVRVTSGTLTAVEVTAPGPGKLRGTLSGDKATWTSADRLAPGVTYTVTASGTASGGKSNGTSNSPPPAPTPTPPPGTRASSATSTAVTAASA